MPYRDPERTGLPCAECSSIPNCARDTSVAFVRRQLGDAAIFAASEAARLLPMRECDAVRWLRNSGLVRDLDGRPVVIWGDVLDHLRQHEESPPPPRPRLPRAGLRRGGS